MSTETKVGYIQHDNYHTNTKRIILRRNSGDLMNVTENRIYMPLNDTTSYQIYVPAGGSLTEILLFDSGGIPSVIYETLYDDEIRISTDDGGRIYFDKFSVQCFVDMGVTAYSHWGQIQNAVNNTGSLLVGGVNVEENYISVIGEITEEIVKDPFIMGYRSAPSPSQVSTTYTGTTKIIKTLEYGFNAVGWTLGGDEDINTEIILFS